MFEAGFDNNIVDRSDRGTASFALDFSGAVPWCFDTLAFITFMEPIFANHYDRIAKTSFYKHWFIWNQQKFGFQKITPVTKDQ